MSWRTCIPDYIGASLTVIAIPRVDVEAGATLVQLIVGSLYLRAGPCFSLYEGRNDAGQGVPVCVSVLAGARNTSSYMW